MGYVVVTKDHPSTAPANLRVRFEFRADLTEARSVTRTVLGVDAACEELRMWLNTIATGG